VAASANAVGGKSANGYLLHYTGAFVDPNTSNAKPGHRY
jgi:hypothetical protein